MRLNFESPLPFAGKLDIEGVADANDPEVTRVWYTDTTGRKADITKLMENFNCLYNYVQDAAKSQSRHLLNEPRDEDYTLNLQDAY